jgi:hypothetical protein
MRNFLKQNFSRFSSYFGVFFCVYFECLNLEEEGFVRWEMRGFFINRILKFLNSEVFYGLLSYFRNLENLEKARLLQEKAP